MLLALCLSTGIALQKGFSQVRLPRLVNDGMVLQRDTRLKIWGWAAPGEKLTVSINRKEYGTRADDQGRWLIELPPSPAGGPYELVIDASNHLVVHDILFGDVWVCSGQSNMVLPMERVKYKYADIIARTDNPLIRQFFVPNEYNFIKQQEDLSSGHWEAATPKSVLHFTATGYFFAKTLFEKYHVPIGLINASVGGAPVEAWLSEETLRSFPVYLARAEQCRVPGYIDSVKLAENRMNIDWYTDLWKKDAGLHEEKKWYDNSYDASQWPVMHLPGYWAGGDGKPAGNGVMWLRKEITLPENMVGQPARLLLGRIIDRDSAYLNGIFVGTIGYQYPPRIYELPSNLLKAGKNILAVRVISNAGRGGFATGKTYALMAGGNSISLEGDWQYRRGASLGPLAPPTFFQYEPLGLFNGLIAPLANYAIKGVIWYQGEANISRAAEYTGLLSAMIADWRKNWQENFPFLFVQLANYREGPEPNPESPWADLREAQRKTLGVTNTAMAVAMDVGEWNDLHPLDKEDVGRRLALAAMHYGYGDQQIVYAGPSYTSLKKQEDTILLDFTNIGTGLVARGADTLRFFTIAGADKKFVRAHAKIIGDQVAVWSEQVSQPVAVKYAWADDPSSANLYNREGLPASPFRTDD